MSSSFNLFNGRVRQRELRLADDRTEDKAAALARIRAQRLARGEEAKRTGAARCLQRFWRRASARLVCWGRLHAAVAALTETGDIKKEDASNEDDDDRPRSARGDQPPAHGPSTALLALLRAFLLVLGPKPSTPVADYAARLAVVLPALGPHGPRAAASHILRLFNDASPSSSAAALARLPPVLVPIAAMVAVTDSLVGTIVGASAATANSRMGDEEGKTTVLLAAAVVQLATQSGSENAVAAAATRVLGLVTRAFAPVRLAPAARKAFALAAGVVAHTIVTPLSPAAGFEAVLYVPYDPSAPAIVNTTFTKTAPTTTATTSAVSCMEAIAAGLKEAPQYITHMPRDCRWAAAAQAVRGVAAALGPLVATTPAASNNNEIDDDSVRGGGGEEALAAAARAGLCASAWAAVGALLYQPRDDINNSNATTASSATGNRKVKSSDVAAAAPSALVAALAPSLVPVASTAGSNRSPQLQPSASSSSSRPALSIDMFTFQPVANQKNSNKTRAAHTTTVTTANAAAQALGAATLRSAAEVAGALLQSSNSRSSANNREERDPQDASPAATPPPQSSAEAAAAALLPTVFGPPGRLLFAHTVHALLRAQHGNNSNISSTRETNSEHAALRLAADTAAAVFALPYIAASTAPDGSQPAARRRQAAALLSLLNPTASTAATGSAAGEAEQGIILLAWRALVGASNPTATTREDAILGGLAPPPTLVSDTVSGLPSALGPRRFAAPMPFLPLLLLHALHHYALSADVAGDVARGHFPLCDRMTVATGMVGGNTQHAHSALVLIRALKGTTVLAHSAGCDPAPSPVASTSPSVLSSAALVSAGICRLYGAVACPAAAVADAAVRLLDRLRTIDGNTPYVQRLLRLGGGGGLSPSTLSPSLSPAQPPSAQHLHGTTSAGANVWLAEPASLATIPRIVRLQEWRAAAAALDVLDAQEEPPAASASAEGVSALVAAASGQAASQQTLAFAVGDDDSDEDGEDGPGGMQRLTGFSLDLRTSSSWTPAQRAVSLLVRCPFILPFAERVQTFALLLQEDRIARRQSFRMMFGGQPVVARRGPHMFGDAYAALRRVPLETLQDRFPVQFAREAEAADDDDDDAADNGEDTQTEDEDEPRVFFGGRHASDRTRTATGVSVVVEPGIGDGVFRDFIYETCQGGLGPGAGLFTTVPAGAEGGIYPHPLAALTAGPDALHRFQLLGALVGRALRDGILLEAPFALAFRNHILGRDNSFSDLAAFDPDLYRSLAALRDPLRTPPALFDDLGLCFAASYDVLGDVREAPLIPRGADVPVTAANVEAYVLLMADFHLNRRVRRQAEAFRRGLYSAVDGTWLRMFDGAELQALFRGGDESAEGLDVADWRRNATSHLGALHSEADRLHAERLIDDFWSIVADDLTPEQQRLLLKFATSTRRAPLLGFAHLDPRFNVAVVPGDTDRLPTAATCMCTLRLPLYRNRATLKEKLLQAIQGTDTFEFS